MIKDPHMISPGDLYEDGTGAVYVVRGVIMEPSITMERVLSKDGNPCTGAPQRLNGGCSGLMWQNFTPLRTAKLAPSVVAYDLSLTAKGKVST